MAPLSPREIEVLDALITWGHNKVIADKLGIGVKTVEAHTRKALQKSGLRSRVLLAVWWDRQRRAQA